MDNGSRTRVALFSHNPLVSEGLCSVFGRFPAFELATWSNDLGEFAASLADQQPDIALLDLASGVTLLALRDLRRRTPNVPIVLWGDPSIEFGFHAIEMGVRGIIPLTTPIEDFTAALSTIRRGQLAFEKNFVERLLLTKRVSLTKREGQLISLISQGLKNKELGYALGITEGTVKVYLSRIFKKLGVNDRFELALYALKNVVSGQNGGGDLAYASGAMVSSSSSVRTASRSSWGILPIVLDGDSGGPHESEKASLGPCLDQPELRFR